MHAHAHLELIGRLGALHRVGGTVGGRAGELHRVGGDVGEFVAGDGIGDFEPLFVLGATAGEVGVSAGISALLVARGAYQGEILGGWPLNRRRPGGHAIRIEDIEFGNDLEGGVIEAGGPVGARIRPQPGVALGEPGALSLAVEPVFARLAAIGPANSAPGAVVPGFVGPLG